MRLTLADEDATRQLAVRIAGLCQAGDAVLLSGPLGSGKTTFARAFLRAAANDSALDVPSPSFTLVQSYETGIGTVHHFDLWRVTSPDAVAELGWEAARDDVVIVEWPDRLGPLEPTDALRLRFALTDDENARTVTIEGWSGRLAHP
jgi:tRNA threonylcarbamoyladenosine biosynthesis protein TsaE